MESEPSLRSARAVWFQLLFVLLPIWISFLWEVDAVTVNQEEEVAALLNFRSKNTQIYERQGYWAAWNESDDNACTWPGVICTVNFTVEELDVSGLGITLSSLEALSALRDLRRLDLSSNTKMYSKALDSIVEFTQLIRLDLSHTPFTDDALSYALGTLENLRFLNLEQTGLRGSINGIVPNGMGHLVNLQFLNFAGNRLSGDFPTEQLGGLSSLLSLDLSGNALSGIIPSLPNFTSLIELKLDGNNFTGFEEQWFLGTNRLQYLSVSNNLLAGEIPATIVTFGNLSVLNMSGNYLSDKIPFGFSTATAIDIDLSHNQLTGEIPPDLLQSFVPRNTNTYSSVNLSNNLLTGKIPEGSGRVWLGDLDLANNKLSGPIPVQFFHENSQILSLRLGNNTFSGDIVDLLHSISRMNVLEAHLENNRFTGDLSRILSMQDTEFLFSVLDLSNNHIQWSVSDAVPDPIQATLQLLGARYDSAGINSPFREFRAGGNNFSGTPLPSACFVYNYVELLVLDLSNSQLEGEISGSAFNESCLPYVSLLNLSNNHAIGSLPESVLADRPRSPNFVVDVYYNNLSGPLPLISLTSNLYNHKYFANNSGLCGGPLPPCPSASPLKQGTGQQSWCVLYIAISASTTVLLNCLVCALRWRVYHKKHQQDADLIKTLLERESAALMPLRELKKATENFAESGRIGEGGFGTVYIGKLNNGTMVAVKKQA